MTAFVSPILALLVASAHLEPAAGQVPSVVQQVTPKASVYIPMAVTTPASLIVVLHGAGGDARSFLNEFKHDADVRGAILLSVQSEGRTWALRRPTESESDVANIKAAIDELRSKTPIDSKRTTVMGFSDGASYALSIGLAYPDLFRTIVAFSPGYAFAPSNLDIKQRIFITHSRRDPILPAANVRDMVKGLEDAGYAPEVHWFNGGHEIDPDLKKVALDFALGATRTLR